MNDVPRDILWLTSSSAEAWLSRTQRDLADLNELHRISKSLRKDLSAERARLVLDQASLRLRAQKKFTAADQMFFTKRALEQSTGEFIAQYKWSVFADAIVELPANVHPGKHLDLCCGVGGDLLFSRHLNGACGIDLDPTLAHFANTNAQQVNLSAITAACGNAEQSDYSSAVSIHIDPDRRAKSRTIRVDQFQPGIALLDRLIDSGKPLGIKLAPATKVPDHWLKHHPVLEWIGHQRECKQQIAWFNCPSIPNPDGAAHEIDANQPAATRRITILANQDCNVLDRQTVHDHRKTQARIATIKRYLLEPHAALLAAGLVDSIADKFDLFRLADSQVFLTSDRPVNAACLSCFEVVSSLRWDLREIELALAKLNAHICEFKMREIPANAQKAVRSANDVGEIPMVLIGTRTNHRLVANICHRLDVVPQAASDSSPGKL